MPFQKLALPLPYQINKAMKVSKKAIDGKEFSVTITKRTFEEVKKIADIEGIEVSINQVWFIEEADCFNPKTKSGILKAADCILENQIEDYEYDNNLRK